jgi:aminobenzoyl-glutamate transport protein
MARRSDDATKPTMLRYFLERTMNAVERVGNRLPDPAALFAVLLLLVWISSAVLASVHFNEVDPRTNQPITINNLLTGPALAHFLATMVPTFLAFPPLGLVLVAMLGVGVAQRSGFIAAALKALLNITLKNLLTPVVILAGVLSHTAGDIGFLLVIPLAGTIFQAAGRHPIAGIAAAFAAVAGGFSANLIPSSVDPLLQGITQSAAQLIDPARRINPLCNWYFTAASSFLILILGWYLTDSVVEPRLSRIAVDSNTCEVAYSQTLSRQERRGLVAGLIVVALGLAVLSVICLPAQSPMRSPQGQLSTADAPLMQAIVPLMFLMLVIPGATYGFVSGSLRDSGDLIEGMTAGMAAMSQYIVMAFFAALFIAAFGQSNLGVLLAMKGASLLKAVALPNTLTIVGFIVFTAFADLLIGSASAKWALLAAIFVPMFMQVGISPELTQAAYRVGDSTTNIVAPLNPFFPLVVVYCRSYVKGSGIGSLISLMLPYCFVFLTLWTVLLVAFWALGLPLGVQGG